MYSWVVSEAVIQIEAASTVPVYRQIVDQVRLHIGSGALEVGEPLPSVRGLAAQLGVHFNTVAEAYRALAEEGWIDLSHGRRATVLGAGAVPAVRGAEAAGLRQRLRHLVAEMRLKGVDVEMIRAEVDAVLKR